MCTYIELTPQTVIGLVNHTPQTVRNYLISPHRNDMFFDAFEGGWGPGAGAGRRLLKVAVPLLLLRPAVEHCVEVRRPQARLQGQLTTRVLTQVKSGQIQKASTNSIFNTIQVTQCLVTTYKSHMSDLMIESSHLIIAIFYQFL